MKNKSSQDFINILCGGDFELNDLKQACRELLDDINDRYPDKNPMEWKCPYIRKIANLIEYKREENENFKCESN